MSFNTVAVKLWIHVCVSKYEFVCRLQSISLWPTALSFELEQPTAAAVHKFMQFVLYPFSIVSVQIYMYIFNKVAIVSRNSAECDFCAFLAKFFSIIHYIDCVKCILYMESLVIHDSMKNRYLNTIWWTRLWVYMNCIYVIYFGIVKIRANAFPIPHPIIVIIIVGTNVRFDPLANFFSFITAIDCLRDIDETTWIRRGNGQYSRYIERNWYSTEREMRTFEFAERY